MLKKQCIKKMWPVLFFKLNPYHSLLSFLILLRQCLISDDYVVSALSGIFSAVGYSAKL